MTATASNPTADESFELAPSPQRNPPRRRREELEALAAEFVAKTAAAKPAPVAPPKALLAAAGVVALAALAWLLWPAADSEPAPEATPAINETALITQRLEAERERRRLELARSRHYLEKMAAADGALVREMAERAQNLGAGRAAAQPMPQPSPAPQRGATAEPSPRALEPTPRTEAATSAAAQPRVADPGRQRAAAQPEPAASKPADGADAGRAGAAAPRCNIHVSELSSSGKLTYADVARMKGARTDERGHVFTPPVAAPGHRSLVFEVFPTGCVQIVRSSLQR